MTVFSEANLTVAASSAPRVKTRMLEQMAEALEDEAAGLYRRAAAFEEEEFLLNKEIGERQTEIQSPAAQARGDASRTRSRD